MATYKVDYVFQSGRNGWLESWYLNSTNHNTALATAETSAATRSGALGLCAFISEIRVSDVDILQDSHVKYYRPEEWERLANGADNPWLACAVLVEAGSLYRRTMWLRGIPDIEVERDAPAAPAIFVSDILKTAVQQIEVEFTSAPAYQLRVRSREGTGALPGVKVITVSDPGVPGLTLLTLASPFAGEAGQYCRMTGWIGPDSRVLNRTYLVVTKSDLLNDVTIALDFSKIVQPLLNVGGKILTRIPGYRSVTAFTPVRIATRKTGRIQGLPRGRRRVAR